MAMAMAMAMALMVDGGEVDMNIEVAHALHIELIDNKHNLLATRLPLLLDCNNIQKEHIGQ